MKRAVLVLTVFVCLLGFAVPASADCEVTTNAGDVSAGSLGGCIVFANMNPGADVITFNIPTGVGGAVTILAAQEYVISDTDTTIDGFSQPGALPNTNGAPGSLNTKLMISVDGSAIGNNGLAVFAVETNHTTIKGLNVHSGPLYEISVGRSTTGCTMNYIQGCFLGTDVNGTIARPSGWLPWNPPNVIGVYVARRANHTYVGSDNDGTDDEAERNLISGEARDMWFAGHGVFLDGSGGMVTNTLIAGNLIGTTPNPEVRLGNNYGVTLFSGVSDNTIAGNVIAGNNIDGVWSGIWPGSVAAVNRNNRIFGNFIGINPNTDNPVPNVQDGIHLNPGNESNEVGNTGWTLANVISGNGRHGVFMQGGAGNDSLDNTFHYNIVGLDTSGAFAVPNAGDGFHVERTQGRNFIGDPTDGNLISGNLGHGVYVIAANTVVIQNNVLGLNMAGDSTQANGGDGVGVYCNDIACCDSTIIWQNRIHGSAGNGIGLYGYHTSSDIGPNTIDRNGGAGIYSLLPDDTNVYWGHTIEYNGGHGIEIVGSSADIDGNTINNNTGWGIVNYPFYGGDTSPATAGNDVVCAPTIDSNDIDANTAGGIVSSDCEPANGSDLHNDNTIGDNNSEPDVLQLWFGAVEIIDSGSPPPITTGAYTVTLTDLEMVVESGTVEDGGLWGATGFDSTDIRTWFTLVQYQVDNAGTFHTHTPHTVVVTGPTGGTQSYTFDGVDNDTDTCNTGGCAPAGIDTGGQFRYQVVEVMTQTDSDGDSVPDAADCAPFDAGFQGTAGGVPCDADSDGWCDDGITGGVQPSACPNETFCTPVLCTPTDCLDSNPAVNPGASEGPTGDPTCSDSLDNDCDTLTDMSDPACPQCFTDSDCDDANDCTSEACTAGMCIYSALSDGVACDDGQYCTDPDTCSGGVCVGSPRVCPDDQCNTGSCNEAMNQCYLNPIADGTSCDDGLYCTENDTCLTGVCTGGSALDCSSLDGQCTQGVCNDASDACEAIPDNEGLACDDGLYCNVGETCTLGNCTGGSARDCSSFDDQCNTGACDDAGDACYADPAPKNGDGCDDGDACSMNDVCNGGACAGAPLDADSDTYVSDACPGGDDCDDSNGAVHPNAAEICDDTIDNDCDGLTDAADPGCAVCIDNDDCDDNNVCNGAETCVSGACVGGTALDCDDTNVCTDDVCDVSAGCQYANNTLPCDDSDACSMDDTCSGGSCAGVPLDADADTYVSDACAGGDDCDDSNGAVHPNAAEVCTDGIDNDCDGDTDAADSACAACTIDDDCDDNDVCNGAETCLGGFCQPGTPLVCDDGNPCTDDTCDSAAGCQSANNSDPCNDGDPCSMNDVCSGGACTGIPLDADSDSYVSDACAGGDDCDDSNGAIHPNAAEICDDTVDNDCDGLTDANDPGCAPCVIDDDCDDANVCNGAETCLAGSCQPGTALDCNDNNPCTDDSCDTAAGCQNVNNTIPCDDGLYCTESDVCAAGSCGGTARDCSSESDQCNQGVCDDTADACVADPVPLQGQACDDNDACTMTDACDTGTCTGVPLDADSDGHVSDACPNGSDCDDSDAAINPDATEVCDDTVDNNCDGDTDGDDADCQGCPDADGDGFASDACGGTDCDDTDSAVNPDAMEMCSDEIDNNCNGDTDLEDDECKRPAGGCNCSTNGSTTPAFLLGLLGLLILRLRRQTQS